VTFGKRPERWTIAIVSAYLALALAYLLIVVPFDSPDENSHYEYALRLASLGRTPTIDDRDPELFASVRDEMLARGTGLMLPRPDGRRELGFNLELGRQPPTYYLPAAAISGLLPADHGARLRRMRLTSLVLGLGVVACAMAAGRLLTPHDRFARWALPAIVAFTPGFLFMSASFNNDALANFGGGVAFVGLLRLARARIDPLSIALAVVGVALGLAGKRTALVLLPMLAIVGYALAVAQMPRGLARLLATAAPVALLVTLPLWGFVESDRARGWQTDRAGQASLAPEALIGERSLLVAGGGALRQVLGSDDAARVLDRGLTSAAWVRSLDGQSARARLTIEGGGGASAQVLAVDGVWRLVRVVHRPSVAGPLRVALEALDADAAVLFDGVALALGQRAGIPQLDDVDGRTGTWGGAPFTNLAANGSGELAGRGPRAEVALIADLLGVPSPTLVLLAEGRLLPPDAFLQRLTFTHEGYLGRFSWLSLPLPDPVYWLGWGLGGLALAGLAWRLCSPACALDRRLTALCALGFGSALAVGLAPFLVGAVGNELPQGRYLYPALLPISGLLALGLARLVPTDRREVALALLVIGGIALNVYALGSTLIPRYTGAL
jgi:hypothetical protein